MNITLALIAVVLMAGSGCLGLFFGRRAAAGQQIATALMLLGGAIGVIACVRILQSGQMEQLDAAWLGWIPGERSPWISFAIRFDALSAVFLLPVFTMPALGSIYGMGYWPQADHPDNGRKLRLFYGLLAGSMAMVVLAQNAIEFLIAWEIMAVAAFFLITTDDSDSAARQSGWVYFVATHLGTLCLLPMFGLLAQTSGSFAINNGAMLQAGGNHVSTAIFVLAVIGFGLKAGIFPLHVWLPGAHANAPSHVSAVLSGVMLKMGVYGLIRVVGSFSAPPEWWGGALLATGAATGLIGIVYAIGQRDLKRLLAYSSIENIGIIFIGIGLAMLGRSLNRPEWVALGLGGALLHVWNHSLFKPLLFFAVGSVIHGSHTREMDRLGGLAKTMPHTSMLFFIGTIAICGLPPLNGFVSEFLVYLGLFGTLGLHGGTHLQLAGWAAFVPPILAMIGGLAIVCFIKAHGSVFLGSPRTSDAANCSEAGKSMLVPMMILAAGCLIIGLLPSLVFDPIQQAMTVWTGEHDGASASLSVLAPTTWISIMGFSLVTLAAIGAVWFERAAHPRSAGTWDCGFAMPGGVAGAPRIQYTGSSFVQMVVGLFRWALWPKQQWPHLKGRFPGRSRFNSDVPDVVLDRGVIPSFRLASTLLPWARLMQHGRVQMYVLYILAILIVLLLWG